MTTAQTAILTITAILLIAWGAYTAYRYITRTHRQLRMLLEAIESADTSLRFPANSDSEVNATLNRIAQSLSALRIRISETEKYYESITGAVATGVIVITPTGHIILANPAALSLLGRQALTRLSALSDSWSELTRLLDGLPTGLNV
ncbi:PAS domain-containing protein [Duncaniella sp.]|uniref:PAS domain-containing protein n=1 Tax=Duncaniella TaxID=2518495 RepID=UPI00257E5AB1|nr:PAS domain-containing protein [Duncaniella sp.]